MPTGIFPGKYEWAGERGEGDCSLLVRDADREFDDGSWRTAFGCDGTAATGRDISAHGSWPAAVAAGAVTENGSAEASTTTPRSGR